MRQDAHGLAVSTDSDAAVAAFDRLLTGYLKYRADLPDRMAALLAADPEWALAHCVQGYLTMLAYKQA